MPRHEDVERAKMAHQVCLSSRIAREQTMSTYIGNGVAIPHGQHENLGEVHRTGISVLQLPNGVDGPVARLRGR